MDRSRTYADAFEEICQTLNPGGCHRWLRGEFRRAAGAWARRPTATGPGFAAGITANGDPFECSLSVGAAKASSTRFIAQICGDPQKNSEACFGFVSTSAVPETCGPLTRLENTFLRNLKPGFRGNFTSWI